MLLLQWLFDRKRPQLTHRLASFPHGLFILFAVHHSSYSSGPRRSPFADVDSQVIPDVYFGACEWPALISLERAFRRVPRSPLEDSREAATDGEGRAQLGGRRLFVNRRVVEHLPRVRVHESLRLNVIQLLFVANGEPGNLRQSL